MERFAQWAVLAAYLSCAAFADDAEPYPYEDDDVPWTIPLPKWLLFLIAGLIFYGVGLIVQKLLNADKHRNVPKKRSMKKLRKAE
ncbi:Uncharacterized protein PBTT_06725 [Plasmodiophora brassicae]